MAQANIARLYQSYEKSFLKDLHSAQSLSPGSIHKLRLDVKRLRSILRLLDYLGQEKKPGKKTLKLIDPVFKKAGSLRNISQNLKQCRSCDSKLIKGFREYLKDKETKLEEKFRSRIKKFEKKKLKKVTAAMVKGLKKLKRNEVIEDSETYAGKLLKRIRILQKRLRDDESFHEVRKKLKDIKAVRQLKEELGVKNSSDEKKLELIEQKIGHWHDRIVFIEETEKYLTKKQKPDRRLARLIMDMKTGNEKLKFQIGKHLNNFMAGNS